VPTFRIVRMEVQDHPITALHRVNDKELIESEFESLHLGEVKKAIFSEDDAKLLITFNSDFSLTVCQIKLTTTRNRQSGCSSFLEIWRWEKEESSLIISDIHTPTKKSHA